MNLANGVKGNKGSTGDKGESGPQGNDGLPGDKGLQGFEVRVNSDFLKYNIFNKK